MLKLIICLFSAFALAVAMLQLRQQRLELNYQVNRLHTQIEDQQAKLWEQQLQVAIYTAPNAISKTVGDRKLDMVARSPMKAHHAGWMDPQHNPDAE